MVVSHLSPTSITYASLYVPSTNFLNFTLVLSTDGWDQGQVGPPSSPKQVRFWHALGLYVVEEGVVR